MWELPAGSIDPGEKPLQTAKRELKEETGYRAKNWKKLISFFPSPGFLTEKMTIFLATGLTAGEATPMGDERIETRWFTAKEIEAAIDGGEILDAKSMLGYFFWKRSQRKGERGLQMRRYPVIIEQTGTGYSTYSPDVPGCAAAGDTPEETRSNFQDALASHF